MFVFLFLVSAALFIAAVVLADMRFYFAAFLAFMIAMMWEHWKEKTRSRRKKSDATQYDQVKKPSHDELKHAHGYAEAYIQGETEGFVKGRAEGYAEGYSKGNTAGYSRGYAEAFEDYWKDLTREKGPIPFDPWQVLEISPNSSQQTIHKAFREQSKLYHPDLVSHLGRHLQEEAESRTKNINRAYDMLRRR